MKRSQLKQLIKEELLKEAKNDFGNITKIQVGDKFKTKFGFIKITDVKISNFHLANPTVYIVYQYDIPSENWRGVEVNNIDKFKEVLNSLYTGNF